MDFTLFFEVGRRDWTFCVRRAGTPKKTAEKAQKDPGPNPRPLPHPLPYIDNNPAPL